ncbi:MAG TPA: hypothetical protein VN624_18425, partial [Rhodanobacter sp.]|nr:hypothetical protein [Rhodanobacter sp.]
PDVVIPAQAGQKRALRVLNSRRLAPKGRAQRVISFSTAKRRIGFFKTASRCGAEVRFLPAQE